MKIVFVILGDAVSNEMLATGLRRAGIFPVVADSVRDARGLSRKFEPDLLLVDVEACDAGEVAELVASGRLDGRSAATPMLMIGSTPAAAVASAASDAYRVFLPHPYSPREVLAQAIRLLRRSNARSVDIRWTGTLRRGPIELDLDRFTMTVDVADATVPFGLGPTVTRLMARLMARAGSVCGRDELLAQVWPDDFTVTPRTVDQNIRRIRSALHSVGLADAIRTVQGEGYSFITPNQHAPMVRIRASDPSPREQGRQPDCPA
jgi:DNA-binding response OmpR family regulator